MYDRDLRQNDATRRIETDTGHQTTLDGAMFLCDLCPAYPEGQRQQRNTFIWVCDDCLPIVPDYLALWNVAKYLPRVYV